MMEAVKKYIHLWPYLLIAIGVIALVVRKSAKDKARADQLRRARQAKKRKRARQADRDEAPGEFVWTPIDTNPSSNGPDDSLHNGLIIEENDN